MKMFLGNKYVKGITQYIPDEHFGPKDYIDWYCEQMGLSREEYMAGYRIAMDLRLARVQESEERDWNDPKPGPDPYDKGLDDEEIEDKEEQMKKQAKMDDDDPDAYKEMPGDKEAREKGKVKTSKHVKSYHELYGDDEKNERFSLTEGVMGEIHQLADEVKSEEEFVSKFFKEYGAKVKKSADSIDWVKSLYRDMVKESVNEGKIKYQRGKTYQSGEGWTVFKSGDDFAFDIKVNNSAAWSTDPHDDRRETLRLMDAGKQRATLRFKSGNIDKFAQQMYDLNDETTWGEKQGLTAKDYADIIRVWIDMRMANESVVNEEKAEGDRGPIDDEKIETALKKKKEETGVPMEFLRIIMRRGMAAWKTGHRPGANQQQWGYARVNSFLTKQEGTWGGADADVAKEVRDGGHDKKLKKA